MRSVDRLVASEQAEVVKYEPNTVAWNESYELKGINHGSYGIYADGNLLKTYSQHTYMIYCLICPVGKTIFYESTPAEAVKLHFMHCSKVHRYVFDDSKPLPVHDRKLQDLIQDCQDYELPFHGYEDHSDCVKQYKKRPDGTAFVACAVHKGNEPKIWLGYI